VTFGAPEPAAKSPDRDLPPLRGKRWPVPCRGDIASRDGACISCDVVFFILGGVNVRTGVTQHPNDRLPCDPDTFHCPPERLWRAPTGRFPGRRRRRFWRQQNLHALSRRRDPSTNAYQPPAPSFPPERNKGRDRHLRPRRRRPPAAPPGRLAAPGRRLHRVPRRPHHGWPCNREGGVDVRTARHERRCPPPVERFLLLGLVLPRRLRRRRLDQRPGLDPGPVRLVRNLPRPPPGLAAPRRLPGRELRRLSPRVHRDVGEPRQPHEREGGGRRALPSSRLRLRRDRRARRPRRPAPWARTRST
jgi:hypothetical protein